MNWLEQITPLQAFGVLLSGWLVAGSMFGVLWRSMVKGTLRTEREVTELREQAQRESDKADTWRQAWQERERVVNTLVEQNARMAVLAEVSTHVLESLPKSGGGET